MTTLQTQACSEPGCLNPAAYRTRTKPTWCDGHITSILHRGGLVPLEPFTKPTAYRLTRCTSCGCEAHYRFEYVLDRNKIGEATCRACHWRSWAAEARGLQGGHAKSEPVSEDTAKDHAAKNGYEYLGSLTRPSLPDDPHRVRCLRCGRISAKRLGDIGWGCSCLTNPRRERQTRKPAGSKKKDLLKDSGLAVLGWWDHDRNDSATWNTVTAKARREAHWRCPDCGREFTEKVCDMTAYPSCPDCAVKRRAEWEVEYARLKQTPVAAIPDLLAAWADEADPAMVMVAGDLRVRRFRCPAGHHPRLSPHSFMRAGCPSCRGNATRTQRLEAVAVDPETHTMNREIASQFHPTLNGKIRLETISPDSRRILSWTDAECGHTWQASPREREKGQRPRCPECRSILDSLAYHFPELAAEWSDANPLTAWQVRPSGQTTFVPEWICANNPAHAWQAPLTSRTAGAGCPECRETGKSKVELDHHAAAETIFGSAASGRPVVSEAFKRRARWLVDVVVDLPDGRKVAIEYDGAYWHADKAEIDTAKSVDLLAAGYLVARLREHPLPPLGVTDPGYVEFVVHATAPDAHGVIAKVKDWVDA
ncbi:zinc-ribbon domain-containing protein [Nocardioides sp.]|uniref:Treble clef zinc finger domain-containing protein n=1 Tax=metagenome TaxID=256318 RepID=A0A2P2BXA9_9ZZZZ